MGYHEPPRDPDSPMAMTTHNLLGQLSRFHQMMVELVKSVPEPEAYRAFDPATPPLAWLLGRSAYLETYWLREVLQGDDDMTARVRHFFATGVEVDEALCQHLPPLDHLLNWVLELQDENLMHLANPALLPEHPLRTDDRLLYTILVGHAELYEAMLVQLNERGMQAEYDYQVSVPLQALPPSTDHADLHQGHYRIGAKPEDLAARDNELPTQVVELHAFRIDKQPVSNGTWLGFIQAGGYAQPEYWGESGWAWLQAHAPHPHHWRRDAEGRWYGVGLNGPFDLVAEEPVSGLSQYEAQAYANWVASQGGPLAGAVLQHEYQWEIAARSRAVESFGRVWEWCANAFHPYTGYQAPEQEEAASRGFDAGHASLRGGCLHTQPILRRSSYRFHAAPGRRSLFSGARLVFPPSKMPWQK